ncbi:MAG TPA: biotin/lipoyl-binding protein [Candidatus Paceibacterota bacterium]|nr:biotin/lipoyl-binding protein [Candidatus Paceibacterota bacterium]
MHHTKPVKKRGTIFGDVSAIAGIVVLLSGIYFFLPTHEEKSLEVHDTKPLVVATTTSAKHVRSANLAFDQTGRVVSIRVEKGQRVSAGDAIAQMDDSEQQQNLLTAQAKLRVEDATLAALRANIAGAAKEGYSFDQAKKQQDALVANAYAKMLSDGLVAQPWQDDYTQAVPTISGRYGGGVAGKYKIIIDRGARYTQTVMRIFGLETVGDQELDEIEPTPMGTKGLFITFGDPIAEYVDTVWYVDVPNTRSSSYTANYNAYIAAKEARDVALAAAGATSETVAAQVARVEQAKIAVEVANIQLQKRTLRAPFGGVVAEIYITAGEVAVATVKVASIVAE